MNRNFAGNNGIGGRSNESSALPVPSDPLLTDKEVAAMLGCGRSTLWRWTDEGVIPKPLKLGGLSRWRQTTIQRVIEKAEQAAA